MRVFKYFLRFDRFIYILLHEAVYMVLMEWAQVGLVILFGLLTSWTDLKERIIKNLHLIIFSILFIILIVIDPDPMRIEFWTNLGLTIVFALFLWFRGVIPAADAKLTMTYALGIPLAFYPSFTPTMFPFIFPLFIAFLLSVGMVLPTSIKTKSLFVSLKKRLTIHTLIQGIIIYCIFFALASLTELLLSFAIPVLVLFVVYFALAALARRWMHKLPFQLVIGSLLIIGIGIFAWWLNELDSYIIQIIAFPIGLVLISDVLKDIISIANIKLVPIKQLTEGMIMPGLVVKTKKKTYVWKEFPDDGDTVVVAHEPEGLDKEDLKKLRSYHMKHVPVIADLPFAPFMFIGVLISVLLTLL